MLRADTVLAAGSWSGTPADSVVLDFDERYRRRFVMTGVAGLSFLLDLAEAAMLRSGDGLKLEDGRIVEVVAAPEPLAEIKAADGLALMRVAWHLGNRHLATEMSARALRIRRDSVIEDMARGLGARVIPVEAPFNPEGGAYVQATQAEAGHGHDHGRRHDHGHDHGHAHDDGHKHGAHGHEGHDHKHGAHGHDHDPDACDHPDHDHDHGHGHKHGH